MMPGPSMAGNGVQPPGLSFHVPRHPPTVQPVGTDDVEIVLSSDDDQRKEAPLRASRRKRGEYLEEGEIDDSPVNSPRPSRSSHEGGRRSHSRSVSVSDASGPARVRVVPMVTVEQRGGSSSSSRSGSRRRRDGRRSRSRSRSGSPSRRHKSRHRPKDDGHRRRRHSGKRRSRSRSRARSRSRNRKHKRDRHRRRGSRSRSGSGSRARSRPSSRNRSEERRSKGERDRSPRNRGSRERTSVDVPPAPSLNPASPEADSENEVEIPPPPILKAVSVTVPRAPTPTLTPPTVVTRTPDVDAGKPATPVEDFAPSPVDGGWDSSSEDELPSRPLRLRCELEEQEEEEVESPYDDGASCLGAGLDELDLLFLERYEEDVAQEGPVEPPPGLVLVLDSADGGEKGSLAGCADESDSGCGRGEWDDDDDDDDYGRNAGASCVEPRSGVQAPSSPEDSRSSSSSSSDDDDPPEPLPAAPKSPSPVPPEAPSLSPMSESAAESSSPTPEAPPDCGTAAVLLDWTPAALEGLKAAAGAAKFRESPASTGRSPVEAPELPRKTTYTRVSDLCAPPQPEPAMTTTFEGTPAAPPPSEPPKPQMKSIDEVNAALLNVFDKKNRKSLSTRPQKRSPPHSAPPRPSPALLSLEACVRSGFADVGAASLPRLPPTLDFDAAAERPKTPEPVPAPPVPTVGDSGSRKKLDLKDYKARKQQLEKAPPQPQPQPQPQPVSRPPPTNVVAPQEHPPLPRPSLQPGPPKPHFEVRRSVLPPPQSSSSSSSSLTGAAAEVSLNIRDPRLARNRPLPATSRPAPPPPPKPTPTPNSAPTHAQRKPSLNTSNRVNQKRFPFRIPVVLPQKHMSSLTSSFKIPKVRSKIASAAVQTDFDSGPSMTAATWQAAEFKFINFSAAELDRDPNTRGTDPLDAILLAEQAAKPVFIVDKWRRAVDDDDDEDEEDQEEEKDEERNKYQEEEELDDDDDEQEGDEQVPEVVVIDEDVPPKRDDGMSEEMEISVRQVKDNDERPISSFVKSSDAVTEVTSNEPSETDSFDVQSAAGENAEENDSGFETTPVHHGVDNDLDENSIHDGDLAEPFLSEDESVPPGEPQVAVSGNGDPAPDEDVPNVVPPVDERSVAEEERRETVEAEVNAAAQPPPFEVPWDCPFGCRVPSDSELIPHFVDRHPSEVIPTVIPDFARAALGDDYGGGNAAVPASEGSCEPVDLSWIPKEEKTPVKCQLCSTYSSASRPQLLKHVFGHHRPRYNCRLCPVRVNVPLYPDLVDHVAGEHTGEWLYRCRLCPARCKTRDLARLHVQLEHVDAGGADWDRLPSPADASVADSGGSALLHVCRRCGFCKLDPAAVARHVADSHDGDGAVAEVNVAVPLQVTAKQVSVRKRKARKKVAKQTPKETVRKPTRVANVEHDGGTVFRPKHGRTFEQEEEAAVEENTACLRGTETFPALADGANLVKPNTFDLASLCFVPSEFEVKERKWAKAANTTFDLLPEHENEHDGGEKSGSLDEWDAWLSSRASAEKSSFEPDVVASLQQNRFEYDVDSLCPKIAEPEEKKEEPEEDSDSEVEVLFVGKSDGAGGVPVVARPTLTLEEPDDCIIEETLQFAQKSQSAGEELKNPEKLSHFFKCLGWNCAFTTNDPFLFCAHLMMHHKDTDDTADSCFYCFSSLRPRRTGWMPRLIQHMIEHHQDLVYQCSLCTQRFTAADQAHEHKRKVHGGSADVMACKVELQRCKEFLRESDVEAHGSGGEVELHPLTFDKLRSMEYGDAYHLLKNPDFLSDQVHRKCAKRLFKCMDSNCGYAGIGKEDFVRHVQGHIDKHAARSSDALYMLCAYCLKNDAGTAEELAEHVLQAHGASKHQCPHCYYRALDVAFLNLHLKWFHPSKKDGKPIDVIPSSSSVPTSLPPVGLYLCSSADCDFNTYFGDEFEQHLVSHDDSVYGCARCGETFGTPIDLIWHWTKHGYHPHECLHCRTGFTDSSAHLRHHVMMHPNDPVLAFCRKVRAKVEFPSEKSLDGGRGKRRKKRKKNRGQDDEGGGEAGPPTPPELKPVVSLSDPVGSGCPLDPDPNPNPNVFPPGDRLFACPGCVGKNPCGARFPTAAGLRDHMRLCSSAAVPRCSICTPPRSGIYVSFRSWGDYFEHVAAKHAALPVLYLCGVCPHSSLRRKDLRFHWRSNHAVQEGGGMLMPVDSAEDANELLYVERVEREKRLRTLKWTGPAEGSWTGRCAFVLTSNGGKKRASSMVVRMTDDLDSIFLGATEVLPTNVACGHCPYDCRVVSNFKKHMHLHRQKAAGILDPEWDVPTAEVPNPNPAAAKAKEALGFNAMTNLAFSSNEVPSSSIWDLENMRSGAALIKNGPYPKYIHILSRNVCPVAPCIIVSSKLDGMEAHINVHGEQPSYQCRHCDAAPPAPGTASPGWTMPQFKTLAELYAHYALHGNFLFHCKTCDALFGSKLEGVAHMQQEAARAGEADILHVLNPRSFLMLRDMGNKIACLEDVVDTADAGPEPNVAAGNVPCNGRVCDGASPRKRRRRGRVGGPPSSTEASLRHNGESAQKRIRGIAILPEGDNNFVVPIPKPPSPAPPPVAGPLALPQQPDPSIPGPSAAPRGGGRRAAKKPRLESDPIPDASAADSDVADAEMGPPPAPPGTGDMTLRYPCDQCSARFKTSAECRVHSKKEHSHATPQQMIQCKFCNVKESTEENLELHCGQNHPGQWRSSGPVVAAASWSSSSSGTEKKLTLRCDKTYHCACRKVNPQHGDVYRTHVAKWHGGETLGPPRLSYLCDDRQIPPGLENSFARCDECGVGGWIRLVALHAWTEHLPKDKPEEWPEVYEARVTVVCNDADDTTDFDRYALCQDFGRVLMLICKVCAEKEVTWPRLDQHWKRMGHSRVHTKTPTAYHTEDWRVAWRGWARNPRVDYHADYVRLGKSGAQRGRAASGASETSAASSFASGTLSALGVPAAASTPAATLAASPVPTLSPLPLPSSTPSPSPCPSTSTSRPPASVVYTCPDCGETRDFVVVAYKAHVESHKLPAKCPDCGQRFGRRNLLEIHYESVHQTEFDPDKDYDDPEARAWVDAEVRRFKDALNSAAAVCAAPPPPKRARTAGPAAAVRPTRRTRPVRGQLLSDEFAAMKFNSVDGLVGVVTDGESLGCKGYLASTASRAVVGFGGPGRRKNRKK